ncbi:MAG: MarR family winged helix-turn-helix transcriptional regulator [Micropepsaceae bacterium]
MTTPDIADAFRILSWIGIIEQLQRTRAERMLKPLGVSFAEFSMLTHFSHGHPPEKTVTGIAADMQQLQPAVTKTVAKLVAKGLVKASPSAADGRSKVLTLTAKGRAAFDKAVGALAPAIAESFAGWSAAEAQALFAGLDRLKIYLDAHR